MYLIAGLGNPGKEYKDTRHNAGFNTIDKLACKLGVKESKAKFHSQYAEAFVGGEKVLLLKPLTYMNNSGIAIREIMDFYKIDIDRLIVIVDDIDIPYKDIRIKKKGSAGTHNGLKSIIYHLGDDNFKRVKIGVGKKPINFDLAVFVLSGYSSVEKKEMDEVFDLAAQACLSIINDGADTAMNLFN